MALFKENKGRASLKGFRQLLPPAVLSSLSPYYLGLIEDYERTLRDDLFRLDGCRAAFYVLMALDNDRFKDIVLSELKTEPGKNYKRYCTNWKTFLRVLFAHAAAPGECEPLSVGVTNNITGNKTNVIRWLMLQDKWLLPSGWKNHFRLSPRGARVVELCIKQCEREYSAFYIGQIELKRERMGNLNED